MAQYPADSVMLLIEIEDQADRRLRLFIWIQDDLA